MSLVEQQVYIIFAFASESAVPLETFKKIWQVLFFVITGK